MLVYQDWTWKWNQGKTIFFLANLDNFTMSIKIIIHTEKQNKNQY